MKKADHGKPGKTKIRVLIVHSIVSGREVLKKALAGCSDIEILGTAPSGAICLIKVRTMNPDIVLLDTGITDPRPPELTTRILGIYQDAGIILITPPAPGRGIISETVSSLQNGAFDFIKRPENVTEEMEPTIVQRRLLPKIRTFSIRRYSRLARMTSGGGTPPPGDSVSSQKSDYQGLFREPQETGKFDIVVIGVSAGGPEALSRVIPVLPATFPLPVVIVLHMPKLFTLSMAAELDKKSRLRVKEAEEGEVICRGTVYLAKGGEHLVLVKKSMGEYFLHLDNGPEVNGCKPSVDVFFFSVADIMDKNVIGVILSGMGKDGVEGIARLKQNGAQTIAQDAETSIVWGMPGAAVNAGVIDEVLPLDIIPARLRELAGCV